MIKSQEFATEPETKDSTVKHNYLKRKTDNRQKNDNSSIKKPKIPKNTLMR